MLYAMSDVGMIGDLSLGNLKLITRRRNDYGTKFDEIDAAIRDSYLASAQNDAVLLNTNILMSYNTTTCNVNSPPEDHVQELSSEQKECISSEVAAAVMNFKKREYTLSSFQYNDSWEEILPSLDASVKEKMPHVVDAEKDRFCEICRSADVHQMEQLKELSLWRHNLMKTVKK
mmetsp:Transcript_2584/g.4000  ORF Transcript_2584/g.4000 Transcript_2584/m.4000 type:complete len:174 (+) Transcript_2584:29-550(+)